MNNTVTTKKKKEKNGKNVSQQQNGVKGGVKCNNAERERKQRTEREPVWNEPTRVAYKGNNKCGT